MASSSLPVQVSGFLMSDGFAVSAAAAIEPESSAGVSSIEASAFDVGAAPGLSRLATAWLPVSCCPPIEIMRDSAFA